MIEQICRLFLIFIASLWLAHSAGASDGIPETFSHSEIPGVAPELTSLDVYSDTELRDAPVVIFVHGGGWVQGSKANVQKAPYFLEFTKKHKLLLVSVGTRLVHDPRSPSTTFREQATDLAAAISWVYENSQRFGGDPSRLFLFGYSAGAHLVALVGTDETYLEKQGLDLSVLRGVISLDVSAYDIPRAVREAPSQGVPVSPAALTRVFGADVQVQQAASPVHHIRKDSQYPPFLIIYTGIFDTNPEGVYTQTLTKVQSEAFAQALSTTGTYAAVYGEPENTHHSIMRGFGADGDGITHAVAAFLNRFSSQ